MDAQQPWAISAWKRFWALFKRIFRFMLLFVLVASWLTQDQPEFTDTVGSLPQIALVLAAASAIWALCAVLLPKQLLSHVLAAVARQYPPGGKNPHNPL